MSSVRDFEIAVLPPPGARGRQLLRAAARTGALAMVDLTGADSDLSDGGDVALVAGDDADLRAAIARARGHFRRVFVAVTHEEEARRAIAAGADAVVGCGNEGGGRVSADSSFVLAQRLHRVAHPFFMRGGIGPRATAACAVAGASGVVIDAVLGLCDESDLEPPLRALLAAMDGSETIVLGETTGTRVRVHRARATATLRVLKNAEIEARGRKALARDIEAACAPTQGEALWTVGQDGAFAARLRDEHGSVTGIVRAYRQGLADGLREAARTSPFAEGSPLARALGTRYAIVQGPMTRVSDGAGFIDAVSQAGALPFVALALLRGKQTAALLGETAARLGDRPWGVGILGFVPPELRAEQIEATLAVRPRYAILAGGRPDQARALEQAGIATFLHAPSPRLVTMFLNEGSRRFVLEGRECGGHVGPLASFVLWEEALEAVRRFCVAHPGSEAIDILLAGGIHDGLSAAMAAATAAGLPANVRLGVLMGSAYLFTAEAVASGAIVASFQEEALRCTETVLLDAEGGHAIRCAPSPFVAEFAAAKRRLQQEGCTPHEVRDRLEGLNVGRLRLASKGIERAVETAGGADATSPPAVPLARQKSGGLFMLGQVAALRDTVVTMAELHRDVALGSTETLGAAARELERDDVRPRAHQPEAPIAIVGMSCLFPGAHDVAGLWANILAGRDTISEVPERRFSSRHFYDPEPSRPDRVVSRWGGFLDAIALDPLRYGIPPASLPSIEPVQLLALETARLALADAGYDRRPFPRERTAVIFGAGGGSGDLSLAYKTRIMIEHHLEATGGTAPAESAWLDSLRAAMPTPTEDSFAGILENVISGRIANRFDLGGPNFTVDAACASSLAALEAAARELRSCRSDVVLAGAADTNENIFSFLMFSKTGALSPTGRCKPFDAMADGIAISEGVAVVVLKRLADAQRDGDRIYAVLRGIGAASDGRDKSLTAPSPNGQRRSLERAYEAAGFSPATLGLVEAHGTGTVVGDRTELETLRSVLSAAGGGAQTVQLGSVKSQLGHTKNAAGMAGLIKIAMALHEQTLPPTLFEQPSAAARDRSSQLFLSSRPRPWLTRRDAPRRAGLSAFGFGGTNFHVVVEEHAAHASAGSARPAELYTLSATSPEALLARIEALLPALEGEPDLRPIDLASALARQPSRGPATARLAIVAADLALLRERLSAAAAALRQGRDPGHAEGPSAGTSFTAEVPAAERVAFLFPGQGSQFPGMLEELAVYLPRVRATFEAADEALRDRLPFALSQRIFPPPPHDEAEERAARAELDQTWLAQPALGAADMALANFLADLGLSPAMSAGLSYGEYPALAAAGAIEFDALMRLSEARGRVTQETQGRGVLAMLAVEAEAETVEKLLAGRDGPRIACRNAPGQVVVGGKKAAVEALRDEFVRDGVSASLLPMSAGFHIPEAAAAAACFAPFLADLDLRPPRYPVYANRTAAPHAADAASARRTLLEHLVEPVLFASEVEAMHEAGARVFVEVGPGQVLSGLTRRILAGRAATIVALQPRHDGRGFRDLLLALARLWCRGHALHLPALYAGCATRHLDLDKLPAGRRELSRTSWLVDGGEARPAHATSSAPRRRESPAAPLAPAASADPTIADSFNASMRAFLDYQARAEADRRALMHRFLEAQERTLQAFATGVVPALPAPAAFATAPVTPELPPAARPAGSQASAAPAPAPAEAVTRPGDLSRLVLDIVADRTGYPAEMLGLDLDMEADLGIDSIKRTEILGGLRERLGIAPRDSDREEYFLRIGRFRTLREVVGWLGEETAGRSAATPAPRQAEPSGPGQESPPAVAEDKGSCEVRRYTVRLEEAPLAGFAPAGEGDGRVLLVEDDGGAAAMFHTALQLAGIARVSVKHVPGIGARVAARGGGHYEADLMSPEAVERLRRLVGERDGAITALVHLLPLGVPGGSTRESAAVPGIEVKTLFHLSRAFATDLRRGRERILALTALGGELGHSAGDPAGAAAAGIAGFLKSLAREWPEVRVKVVDLNLEDNSHAVLALLQAELMAEDDAVEVGLTARGRRRPVTVAAPLTGGSGSGATLPPGAVVVATGGGRGITAAVCRDLARRFQPRFVLIGRSPLPGGESPDTAGLDDPRLLKKALAERTARRGETPTPMSVEAEYRALRAAREIAANLEALRQAGSAAEYVACDARDADAFTACLRSVYQRHGRIDGVIHGAGVIEDAPLAAKSPEAFARVFDTKVVPALVMARELRPEGLRFLVFFSSVAARFGNDGQSDYAAANEVLDVLATRLNQRWPARVVALAWGPWAEVGMAAPHLRAKVRERGFEYLDPDAGCGAFVDELARGDKADANVILFARAGEGPVETRETGVAVADGAGG